MEDLICIMVGFSITCSFCFGVCITLLWRIVCKLDEIAKKNKTTTEKQDENG